MRASLLVLLIAPSVAYSQYTVTSNVPPVYTVTSNLPVVKWVFWQGDPDRHYLYRDGQQIGAYCHTARQYRSFDGKEWGEPTAAPIAPPQEVRAAELPFGPGTPALSAAGASTPSAEGFQAGTSTPALRAIPGGTTNCRT